MRWQAATSRRMPTTSTTAYGTTPMGSRRWHRNAANCWAMPAASAASGKSPTSLTPSMGKGPTWVRRFVQDTHALGDRTPDQWQQDAFGQIDALLRAMALRG